VPRGADKTESEQANVSIAIGSTVVVADWMDRFDFERSGAEVAASFQAPRRG
jgi:hypothetical protein